MIDKNKQYTTRSGLPVRIYATDGRGEYTVHGAILEDDEWNVNCWTYDGRFTQSGKHLFDLIEAKPRIKRTLWVNVYDDFFNSHASREIADDQAAISRLACIQIEIDCEEGEGL